MLHAIVTFDGGLDTICGGSYEEEKSLASLRNVEKRYFAGFVWNVGVFGGLLDCK
jgi:hypothetical protein